MDKQNNKKYTINKSRQNMFWASCGYWIQDTFDIDFMEAHLYNLIMRKQFLVGLQIISHRYLGRVQRLFNG